MAPGQGGKGTPDTSGGKGRSGPAAARRAVLAAFGVAFVVLFAIVAIGEGIGDPSIPDGDVALVEDAPDGSGEITKAKFEHALEQTAAGGGLEKVPKPGDDQYDELKEAALKSIFERIWIQGLAEERGVTATQKELDESLQEAIDESFGGSKKEFDKYLKEAHYTQADVDENVKVQVLSKELQEELGKEVPEPSEEEIEDYYEAAKATQFTQPPNRDVRLILNKEEEKAEKALAALEGGNTAKDWGRVAKEFSEDPATKEKGGLQENVIEGGTEEPVGAAYFEAAEGQLEGPIKAQRGFYVFEVVGSTPESVQPLKDVQAQIESTIAQRLEQDFFASFVADFQLAWKQRTFCAPGFLTGQCANFEGDSHPEGALPACYEEDPKEGLPEGGCPAPVFQLQPALPGSVTPLEPTGKPMAQRPQPVPSGGAEEAESAPLPVE